MNGRFIAQEELLSMDCCTEPKMGKFKIGCSLVVSCLSNNSQAECKTKSCIEMSKMSMLGYMDSCISVSCHVVVVFLHRKHQCKHQWILIGHHTVLLTCSFNAELLVYDGDRVIHSVHAQSDCPNLTYLIRELAKQADQDWRRFGHPGWEIFKEVLKLIIGPSLAASQNKRF